MLNYPRIAYNKWGTNPVVRWASGILSNLQRKMIFRGTGLEPILFPDHSIDLGQATHPDLIYDAQSKRFLMTVSNYPYGIERKEDSYVLTSKDGVHFTNLLDGAIETYGGEGDSHFSDGDIVFDGKKYNLFYRFCERDMDKLDIISICTSADGKNWTKSRKIISTPRDGLVSPTLVYCDEKFIMYYIALDEHGSKLYRCESRTNTFDKFPENLAEMTVQSLPDGMMLWHLNVTQEGRKLHGLFTLSTGFGGADARLYYAEGSLDSDIWTIKYEIDPIVNEMFVKKVYRSALVSVDGIWYLYMAICTKWDCWYIARRRFSEICSHSN